MMKACNPDDLLGVRLSARNRTPKRCGIWPLKRIGEKLSQSGKSVGNALAPFLPLFSWRACLLSYFGSKARFSGRASGLPREDQKWIRRPVQFREGFETNGRFASPAF